MCAAVFVFTQAELPLELNCWLTGAAGWHPEPPTGKACLGNQHKTQPCLFGQQPTSKHTHRHRQTGNRTGWERTQILWLCLSLICFQEWQVHDANPKHGTEQVREHLYDLNAQKPMGPHGMHPWMLRLLADMIVRPFLSLKGHGNSGRLLWTGGKQMSLLSSIMAKRRTEEWQVSQAHLILGKMEQNLLETISKHVKHRNMTGTSQYSF